MTVTILYKSPHMMNKYSSVEGFSFQEALKKLDKKFVEIMRNNPHIPTYEINGFTIHLKH